LPKGKVRKWITLTRARGVVRFKHMRKKCDNCSHYTLRPRRVKVISAGVLLLFCGFVVTPFSLLRDVGHLMEAAGVMLFVISVFVAGDECQNCKKTYVRRGIEA
jgi:hypothetical protein